MLPEPVIIGDATLYCGDCLEILPGLGEVDVVIADPPYGVNLDGYDDTPETVKTVCVPAIELCREMASRVALTPGIRNQRMYPQPDGEGVIFCAAGVGLGPWGFTTHHPLYYYGKCPYLAEGKGSRPTGFQTSGGYAKDNNGHPCPKPLDQMKWIVNRVSRFGETILDPFMGSGSTGVAALDAGRSFIGIELDPAYFDIACERIDQAQRQQRLFA